MKDLFPWSILAVLFLADVVSVRYFVKSVVRTVRDTKGRETMKLHYDIKLASASESRAVKSSNEERITLPESVLNLPPGATVVSVVDTRFVLTQDEMAK